MASKSALVQKVGFLWVKQHTVVKTWQLRYVLFKKCTGYETDACLEWYESQEAYSNCQTPKELKFNEINYAGNWVSQSKDFAFIIIVSDQKNLQLAARTETERSEWIEVFNKFLHKPCNMCVPCGSTSCSHITRTYVKRGSIVQADSYIRRRDFPVKFRNSTLGNQLDPDKDYVINVGREYVTVSISDQVEPARANSLGWLLTQIRTYNSQPVEAGSSVRLLTIETGRQSSTGEGFFYFLTQHGDEIVNQIRLNTSRSYLQKKSSMDNSCVDTCGTSPEPRLLTSIPRPPGCHLFPRPSLIRPTPPGAIPFHAYDGDPTAGSEPFAHYVRGKNNYIDVLTPQEEVEKFKRRKGSRPSFDREPTSPERQPRSPDDEPPFPVYDPSASNQPNHYQSREDEFSEYDAEHPTYLEVLGEDEPPREDSEVAKNNGEYVNMVQPGSRDGEFEKKESPTQFPMDSHEVSASPARDSPLSPRDSPSSARASFASTRASHTSTGWNSQTSRTSSVAFSSVSSENDVFREKGDNVPGDVFPHEPAKSRQRPFRISEDDEEPNTFVSLSELEISEPGARASLEGERDAIPNDDANGTTVQNSENFRRKEANSKSNSWEAVSGTDSDHAETSSSSEVGTSARNSRELSDEVVSGGEADVAAGGPAARQRTSSDTSKRRESSGDSDGDGRCGGGNESIRNRSATMNDAMLLRGYSPQMLRDLLKRVENPQDFPPLDFAPPNFAPPNNHPPLKRESSVLINEKVIEQLQNPTRVGEHRAGSFPGVRSHSTGEIKYVCGECGWHKMRSKGSRKRSAVRKDKKCERCKRIIKSPKSPKKERSPSILNRFKEVLHRSPSTSLDSLAPERPPLDTPNTLAAPPLLFVKQLHSGVPTFNPALDSKLGVLGIAPSPAHTAHAQSIGGEIRSSPRLVPAAGNESASPKSRRGTKGTLALSRSEGALAKGSCLPATVQRSPKTTTNGKDMPLVRTISSPVFTGSAEGPFEAVTKEMGGNEEKSAKKLSGSNLPSLPEVEDPSGETEEWNPVPSSVESPPAIPPRTRDEPPPVPPRRSSGVLIQKDELNRLKRSETAPTSSLTTMSEGSPKLPSKQRISRTMTDPGCCGQENSIRNALSLGDLLEDESKNGGTLVAGLSLSLGDHLDTPPPPLPPRKHSGAPQPPPLSPRRTLDGSERSNNSCEVQTTESSVSYESEHQTSQSCPPERASEKAPLTSKRSLEARRHYQSRNAMYREHVTESEAVNAT